MLSTQMEEHQEFTTMGPQLRDGNHIQSLYLVKFRTSPPEIEKEEAAKQYQLLTLARTRINKDLEQRKGEEHQINRKLMWFSRQDHRIQWKTEQINFLDQRYLGKVEPNLPKTSVPRTTGIFSLPEKDARVPVRPDRKRCQKRLIKKGRMDIEYLQEVHEELLSSKKSYGMTSSGTQELNDLIDCIAQRIQHGNSKRADEMKIYHEMRKVKETRETYAAPEPKRHSNWYSRQRQTLKQDIDLKRSIQLKINILLDDIEDLKVELKGRKSRVTRLKEELGLVRKSISCLQKDLEDVNTKRIKAYKRAYELGEQKKGLVQRSNCKVFRDDYEKRKLVPTV